MNRLFFFLLVVFGCLGIKIAPAAAMLVEEPQTAIYLEQSKEESPKFETNNLLCPPNGLPSRILDLAVGQHVALGKDLLLFAIKPSFFFSYSFVGCNDFHYLLELQTLTLPHRQTALLAAPAPYLFFCNWRK